MTESPRVHPARSSTVAIFVGIAAIVVCLVLGGVIVALGNRPLAVDVALFDFGNDTRSPLILAVSQFLNTAGAQVIVGAYIPVLFAILFIIQRRGWAAVAVLLCGIASAPLVGVIKSVLERPRPDEQLVRVTLSSYPSGHVANLAAVLVVLALVFGWRWFSVLVVVLIAVMGLSRMYLNVHWFTDDIGALLLGAGMALVVWGVLASRIRGEWGAARNAAA